MAATDGACRAMARWSRRGASGAVGYGPCAHHPGSTGGGFFGRRRRTIARGAMERAQGRATWDGTTAR